MNFDRLRNQNSYRARARIAHLLESRAEKRRAPDGENVRQVQPRRDEDNDTQLWDASRAGDVELVVRLVRGGANLKKAVVAAILTDQSAFIERLGRIFDGQLINNRPPNEWDDERVINRIIDMAEQETIAGAVTAFPDLFQSAEWRYVWRLAALAVDGDAEQVRRFVATDRQQFEAKYEHFTGAKPLELAFRHQHADAALALIELGYADDYDDESPLEALLGYRDEYDEAVFRRLVDALLERGTGFAGSTYEDYLLAFLRMSDDREYVQRSLNRALANSGQYGRHIAFTEAARLIGSVITMEDAAMLLRAAAHIFDR